MTPEGVNLSKDDTASSTVDEWSRRLGIPATTLLHHAICTEFKVFFIPSGVNYAPRYVSVDGLDLDSYFGARPAPLPPEALSGSPYLAGKLFGFCLDEAKCAELCKSPHIDVTFHKEMMHATLGAIDTRNSEKNTWDRPFPSNTRIVMLPTSAPDYLADGAGKKISIAQHIDKQAWSRSAEEFLRTPLSFMVEARHVRIRDVEMADFLSRIRNFAFIDDMYDGEVITKSLPPYVSKKLVELISANRLFWSESADLKAEQREARRKDVLIYLSGSFQNYCPKQSKPAELMEFAAEACDPYMVDVKARLSSKTITPLMLGLLTASKLFVSASLSLGSKATRDKKAIAAFLRSRKLSLKPHTAATLLMPERASKKPK